MHKLRIILLIVLALSIGACQRLTVQNFEAIEPEMTKKEVKRILGKPTVETKDLFVYRGKDFLSIEVQFEKGRVVDKFYQDEDILLGLKKPPGAEK